MTMQDQIGILADVIFDIVERDESQDLKSDAILKYLDGNDRLAQAFIEFITWFKPVEEDDAV